MTNLDSILKSHHFADKCSYSQSYGFSSSHVQMWELDHKEGWVPKNWCFWIVVLEMTLESPLDCKEIKPVNSKGNQSWIFIGRTDAEAEAPILWPPDAKNWLTEEDEIPLMLRKIEVRRGWDGWMASPIQCTQVWANSRGYWRTGKPGVLQSQSQTQPRDWTTAAVLDQWDTWASSSGTSF